MTKGHEGTIVIESGFEHKSKTSSPSNHYISRILMVCVLAVLPPPFVNADWWYLPVAILVTNRTWCPFQRLVRNVLKGDKENR